MAAKCNIVDSALAKLDAFRFGIAFKEGIKVVDNYVEYLACPTYDYISCYPSDCNNGPKIYNCFFSVGPIVLINTPTTQLVLSLQSQDIKPDYKYLWSFDEDYWIVSGLATGSVVTLLPKPGIDITKLVTLVRVKVTNKEGCEYIRECYFVAGTGMKCVPYDACFNVDNLQVTRITTVCEATSALVVLPV